MATTTTLGNDVITGTAEDDILYGDIAGGLGILTGNARGGDDQLIGGGDDLLTGEARFMSGSAQGGDDRLSGGEGNDDVEGDAEVMSDNAQGGDDRLSGGGGDDRLWGDAIIVNNNARGGDDRLDGGEGRDLLYGDAVRMFDNTQGGNDRLSGGEGDDYLFGDAVEISVNTQGGDDELVGGGGDDQLVGGGGKDTFIFSGIFGNDTIGDFRQGEDLLAFGPPGIAGIDDLTIAQGIDHTLVRVEGFGSLMLLGFTGTLTEADLGGPGFIAKQVSGNYKGTPENEDLIGSDGPDTIDGAGGNDTIDGGFDDVVDGGAGSDFLFYDLHEDVRVIGGGTGFDTLLVKGSAFGEAIVFDLRPTINGVDLTPSDDTIVTNVERIDASEAAVSITVFGRDVRDQIKGSQTDDNLTGGGGNDDLIGNGGDDRLEGGIGNDLLVGGAGIDALLGEAGADTLVGGANRDFFVLEKSGVEGDVFRDFVTRVDTIRLFGFGEDATLTSLGGGVYEINDGGETETFTSARPIQEGDYLFF